MATRAKKPAVKKKKTSAKKTGAARPKKRPAPRRASRGNREPAELKRAAEVIAELDEPEAKASRPTASIPSVSAIRETITTRTTSGVRNRDITAFLRQLIMMLDAGTPIVKALRSLSQRGERRGIRNLVSGITEYVEAGNPLWQAFARDGKYFPPVFVNLIKASEASGTLTTVLRRLVEYREKREQLKRYVQVAMIYPAILSVLCFAVIVVLSKFVIPEFRDLFKQMDVEISAFPATIMAIADFVAGYWWTVVLAVGGLYAAYKFWWLKNPMLRLASDHFSLRVPVLGGIARRSVIAEFNRTFGMLLSSGVSMMSTLDLCSKSVSNQAFVSVIQDMRTSVETGEGLEAPLRNAERRGLMPGVVVDMMMTGEESGSLDRITEQIALSYEEEVEIAVSALKETLAPVFVVIMGLIVGTIVLAMFLPLVEMINNIASGAV